MFMFAKFMELIMYDSRLPINYMSFSDSDIRSFSLYGLNDELPESGEYEEDSKQDRNSDQDSTVYLDNISANTDLLVGEVESLSLQIDNLNNNLITLHNDLKIGIGFGFVLMVYICIKCAFGIFNKVFASDKW